jgi:hypothetical protein
MKGIAELYVSQGEYNLRAEFLRPGDIFNQNLFLLGIPVQVNIKCLSDLEVLQLHSDKVTHLRKMKDESTLNTEIHKVITKAEQFGYDKLYMDYIRRPILKGDMKDEATVRKYYENHRRLKNASFFLLMDFRAKNKKQTINEILQQVIMKDKEKRKADKIKLIELMRFDARLQVQKEV